MITENDKKRLETNNRTRSSILTAHFSFAVFFFIILAMTKQDGLIFIALLAWIIGKILSYLFIKFLPITLDDLNDNHLELPDGKYKPYL